MTIQSQIILLCNLKPISLLHNLVSQHHQNLQLLSISSRRHMLTTAAMLMLFSVGVDVVAAAQKPEILSHLPTTHPPPHISMPPHSRKGNRQGRFFDTRAESVCWAKAKTVHGRDPDRWRMDTAGNIVFKGFHNCQGCLCFQYDHILPYSKGGPSIVENCQILQTRVNRLKSDKTDISTNQLKAYSCDISFDDYQLDIIEISFYGNIIRPVDESRENRKSAQQIPDCKLP